MPNASATAALSAGTIPRAAVPLAERVAGWVLAAPALILMWLMLLGPALAVLVLSFTDWTFGSPQPDWAGAANYRELMADRIFWVSLKNTPTSFPSSLPISVAIALAFPPLTKPANGSNAFNPATYFLPAPSPFLPMPLFLPLPFIQPSASLPAP